MTTDHAGPHGLSHSAPPVHPLRSGLLKAIGPGILLAGAAIGVSHLVQATRAGADFGFLLLPLLLLACATKYPFLEFGPRYAAATGETLIEGYRRLGRWALWTMLLVTAGSMFIVMTGVTVVTAALAALTVNLVAPVTLHPALWSAGVIFACMVVLVFGRYAALDRTMKIIMSILLLSTIAALVMALLAPQVAPPIAPTEVAASPPLWSLGTFAFILAFMGWMPIPIDAAVWHSIWTQERGRQTGHRATMEQARFDFNAGYILAALVAVVFLTLGALVMFGRSASSGAGTSFATRFIEMYGETLGAWSVPIIAVAALTTMFSTTLVVLDAFPRVMQRLIATLRGVPASRRSYALWVAAQAAAALVILTYFGPQMTRLVDIATTLSFLTAPVLAVINYRVVTGPHMPAHARPGRAMRHFSIASIIFLTLFSVAYVVWRFAA